MIVLLSLGGTWAVGELIADRGVFPHHCLVIVAMALPLSLLLTARIAPNHNQRGQHAPTMWKLNRAIWLALLGATAFEYVLFGLLGGGWSWPWDQVQALNGVGEEPALVQPALALLTPYIALVTAVFAYRKGKLALADSQRADVAAFQQRFIDASTLLAASSAPARVAGARALGSLARDWVDNRQECVDVICGYLKVKPSDEHLSIDHSKEGADKYTWKNGEDTVREALVDELRRLFAERDVPNRKKRVNIHLTRAWLAGTTGFGDATFTGDAWFNNATFTGPAWFDNARFAGMATFDHATFASLAWFSNAEFSSHAWFEHTTFADQAMFDSSSFTNHALFADATFTSPVVFDHSTFKDDAWFEHTTFEDDASFRYTTFRDLAWFFNARFTEQHSTQQRGLQMIGAALGPLSPQSASPVERGSLVDHYGNVIGDAEWTRAEDDEDD